MERKRERETRLKGGKGGKSLYARLLVLGLVVTKESIKPAHNLAADVCGGREDRRRKTRPRGKKGKKNLHPGTPVRKWPPGGKGTATHTTTDEV